MPSSGDIGGDVDIASAAALFADPTRARILVALSDGRSLPASVLAAEAGVSPQATSAQLKHLRAAGLIGVERSGRHRYHRLASEHVGVILEALARVAPVQPVRSLRQGTRAARLRNARSCYDHLAGRLGVRLMRALLTAGVLVADDGLADTRRRADDRLAQPLARHPYRLGDAASAVLTDLGVDVDALTARPGSRPLLRACMDWSEQEHHLAGRLGAAVLSALLAARWTMRVPDDRALLLTTGGEKALARHLPIDLTDIHIASPAEVPVPPV